MRYLLFLLILYAVSPIYAHDECVAASGTPLRLGAIFPPDTLFDSSTGDAYRGVETMVEAWNKCGGGRPVELVYVPAADREETLEAIEELRGEVPLIIGSGSSAVSEALVEAAAQGDFILWEVTEPLDNPHDFAFSPRPNNIQLGLLAANYVTSELEPVLNGEPLRLAVIYEDQPRAVQIAMAAIDQLEPEIARVYDPENTYRLAVQMRENDINVMLFVTLDVTAERLEANLLQADTNLKAWVQVSGEFYQPDMCKVVSVNASGLVSEESRLENTGIVYEQYRELYEEQPSVQADLAASGVYLLLHDLLPEDNNVEAFQNSIMSATPETTGLMGEGWLYDAGMNSAASAVAQQYQPEGVCTLWPDPLATCSNPLMSFPTWREQVRSPSPCGR